MLLEPNLYLNSVKDITVDILRENKIKGLILDVDNTLIDFNENILEGVKDWIVEMKKQNMKCKKKPSK